MNSNKTIIPMTSSLSQDHFTPDFIIKSIEKVVGGSIDLDAASNPIANKLIKARRFYDEDSLSKSWKSDIVYCNPPGGRTNKDSNVKLFWNKALSSFNSGEVKNLFFMFFSHEAMIFCEDSYSFITCVFSKRLKFIKFDGVNFIEQGSPAHASALVLMTNSSALKRDFISEFQKYGNILVGLGKKSLENNRDIISLIK